MNKMIRVLIINNDKKLTNKISNYLVSSGITVYKINNSNKLNEKIFKVSPHLLILDCNIVPVNAYEICREYKEKHLPIILTKVGKYSSETKVQDKKWAMMQGAKELLYLPCNGEYLIKLVKEMVSDDNYY